MAEATRSPATRAASPKKRKAKPTPWAKRPLEDLVGEHVAINRERADTLVAQLEAATHRLVSLIRLFHEVQGGAKLNNLWITFARCRESMCAGCPHLKVHRIDRFMRGPAPGTQVPHLQYLSKPTSSPHFIRQRDVLAPIWSDIKSLIEYRSRLLARLSHLPAFPKSRVLGEK